MQVLKILSLVCWSVMFEVRDITCVRTASSCSSKYCVANCAEPIGVPRRRNPSVSSTPVVDCEFGIFLLEYSLIDSLITFASSGLISRRGWMMLVPSHDVSIRDFCGLMKHPRSLPRLLRVSRKNLTSMCGTVLDTSSTHAKMCDMLPNPSSPASPLRNRS